MKKYFPILLLAFVSLFIFSCKDDDTDFDTYSQSRDATGTFTSSNNFTLSMDISIESTDVVLVYRRVGNAWESIPKTYYLSNVTGYPTGRELDYNFDFNTSEVNIRTAANFNQITEMSPSEATQYLSNQTFRIVLVPASAGKNTNSIDTTDYNAVVKYYNIDESRIKTYSFR
ncbi:hypothetical protein [Chryseobacterium hispalense]|uniref:hypothetical protein n=1 Tax=Chryseobacterium hispalense TaxID=1453492 RepID=UPI003919484E